MPPVPFRDRPVLTHIVEQHAEEAAFLWTLRDAATDAPHYKRHHLARLDERVEAHVDGLRVAGEAGWRIALEQLERRCEKGELFAASVLALESGDMRRIEPLVARAAAAEPGVRRGFVGAVAWCEPALLAPTVRAWDGSAQAFERYFALCACSVHRADAGPKLAALTDDADALARARALRLAGELGRIELLEVCLRHLDDTCEAARFWASWSAVVLGDHGHGLQTLRTVALARGSGSSTALEVAVRAAGIADGARFTRMLSDYPSLRRSAVVALGHLGDPAAVPWLLARLADPMLSRVAGEAFAMITGADLAFEDLDLVDTPPAAARMSVEEPQEHGPRVDPDEFLPWPDPNLVSAWWKVAAARIEPGTRHLLGQPLSAVAVEHAWAAGFQRHRRAASIEAALLQPGAPLRAWRTRAA